MARSRIGLDPSGNTDRGATAVWSAWDRQSTSATEGWREIQVEVPAAGRIMTLFLDFEQRDGSTPGNQWRINCFDGASIEDLDAETHPRFNRGDCNDDHATDLTDAVFLLGHLFLGSREPGCISACDANDDGKADLSDAVAILTYLFLGGAAPPAPRGTCGEDPTEDALTCVTFEC